MKFIFRWNLVTVLFFLLSLLISRLGFPFFQYVAGTAILITIGLNVSWFIESITGKRLKFNIFSILSVLSAPLVLAFTLYAGILLNHNRVSENIILISSLSTQVLCAVLLTATTFLYKSKTFTSFTFKDFVKNKYLLTIIGIILVFLGVNFLLYPYIPEADGYTCIAKLSSIVKSGILPTNLARVLFYVLSLGIHYLTDIPMYWIFKIFFPLLTSAIFLPFYFIGKEQSYNSRLRYLITLLPFCVPVVVMELLYARPQLIFILFFVLSLYLIVELFKEKERNYYIPLLLFFLSVIGIKCHEFFIFTTIIFLVVLIVYFYPLIRKKPLESVLIIIFILGGSYPWARDLGLIQQFTNYGRLFGNVFHHSAFRWWFIDSYVNTDGNQMGWPGVMSLFYYGYNLGFILVLIIVALVMKKIKIDWNFKIKWPYYLTFVMFFLIAEVFPRFGLGFLPDRAWLFVSLSLCLILIFNSHRVNLESKLSYFLLISLVLGSFILSWSVTYLKKGWVMPDEVKAAQYIDVKTPSDSVIVTQPGNFPLISSFAHRFMITPDSTFFTKKSDMMSFLEKLPQELDIRQEKEKEVKILEEILLNDLSAVLNNSSDQDISKLESDLSSYRNALQELATTSLGNSKTFPIYIVYSREKFAGLYGMRQWWKQSNFYDSKLDIFDGFELIYHDDGIYIWKYK